MRLDRDGIDRSPLDRSGDSLQPGEFRVNIIIATGISVPISNVGFAVPISLAADLSATITSYPASFSVNIPVDLGDLDVFVTQPIAFSVDIPVVLGDLSAAITNHPASFSINIPVTLGAVDVRITPTINIDELLVSATVRRSLTDKMATATFEFDKTSYAGVYSSIYWTKLILRVPDYAGNWNVIFSGIAPSSQTNYTNVVYGTTPLGNQSVRAYDYQWYLTSQTLEPEDQVLLTYSDQQTDYTYKLKYKNPYAGRSFVIGNTVRGATSGDKGTLVMVDTATSYIYLKAMIGSAPYYQDSEHLLVGADWIADADGAAVSYSGYPPSLEAVHEYPTNYVWKLLGGFDGSTWGGKWAEMTGIYPKSAGNDASWAEKEFVFTPSTTKAQAIEQICQYMKWIFYVRYETISGTPAVPCAYFFDESNLDTVGCLPTAVYVTSGSGRASPTYPNDAGGYLVSPFTLEQSGESQYNWVEVRCQAILDGQWYRAVEYDSDVYDATLNPTGTVRKVPYYEVNPNISTSTDCTARAADIWSYYQKQVVRWKATFELRSDLALLQKLIIDGFDPALPNGDYRIIDIEYTYDASGTRNYQKVTLINDDDFRAYLNLKRVYLNSIYDIQNIAKDLIDKSVINQVGTVIAVSSSTVIVAVDGTYGAVKRTAYGAGATFTAGEKVTLSLDGTGRLIASHIG